MESAPASSLAEAVVAGPDIDETDVLDLVTALADRSLLQVGERDGQARYRLLETIRLYATERLAELDDPPRVRDRHLAFHVGLASRAQEGLTGGQPDPWMARLAAALDDLRAAMDWAAESGDLQRLVDITEPIVRFWFERGLSGEVHRRLHAAVDAPDAGADEGVRGLLTATALAAGGGEFASACRLASRAVDASRAADVGGALATALGLRAWTEAWSGRSPSEQVDADVQEAVRLAERGEDASTHAYVLVMAAGGLLVGRTIDAGCGLLEQAVEVCETDRLVFELPSVHATLGWWLALSGRLDQARRHARRGFELSTPVRRSRCRRANRNRMADANHQVWKVEPDPAASTPAPTALQRQDCDAPSAEHSRGAGRRSGSHGMSQKRSAFRGTPRSGPVRGRRLAPG